MYIFLFVVFFISYFLFCFLFLFFILFSFLVLFNSNHQPTNQINSKSLLFSSLLFSPLLSSPHLISPLLSYPTPQRCKRPILDAHIEIGGKHFHEDCLICENCGKKATKDFYEDNGKIYHLVCE